MVVCWWQFHGVTFTSQSFNVASPPYITLLPAILSKKPPQEPPTDSYFKLCFPSVGSLSRAL